MKLVCLELSFDAAGRSAADNLARPNYCAIEIHFSIGDRTIRGEKQISIRALSLSLYLSTYIYIYIYSRLSVFREPFDPIPSINSGSKLETPHLTKQTRGGVLDARAEERSVFRRRNLNISRPMARHPRALQPSKIRSASCPRLPDVKYKAIS